MSIPKSSEGLPEGLKYVEPRDKRSDEEIFASLLVHKPVVSERNIWAFWHSGASTMKGWYRRNIINWVRLNGSDWTVRILDKVPGSPNNVLNFVSEDQVPQSWIDGTMDGPFVGQHSADFTRSAVLGPHGGVWFDVGIILFRRIDDICWRQLEDPASPFEVCAGLTSGTGIVNSFIAARKESPLIRNWHNLFLKLWEGRANCDGLVGHPLLLPVLIAMAKDPEASSRFGFEFAVDRTRIIDYVAQITAWSRVCMSEDCGDGFNGVEYWSNKVLLLDGLQEEWGAEQALGSWNGQALYDVLNTRLDAPKDSEEYKKAERVVWTILGTASMQKIFHGKTLLKSPSLATLWDTTENTDADIRPGTFAELLRYGSIHYEQTRQIEYVKAPVPEDIIKKGLFEA